MFKNGVLMRVFECKRDEVTGGFIEINDFCFEPNINGMIKSITMEGGGGGDFVFLCMIA